MIILNTVQILRERLIKKLYFLRIKSLGLTDNAILIRNINKDDVIKLDDVNLDLPEDIIKAREYQYNTLK